MTARVNSTLRVPEYAHHSISAKTRKKATVHIAIVAWLPPLKHSHEIATAKLIMLRTHIRMSVLHELRVKRNKKTYAHMRNAYGML